MSQPRSLDRVAVMAMLLLCASWGMQYVATKVALEDFPPLMQSGLRSILATLIVGGVALRGEPRLWRWDGTEAAGIAAGLLFSAMLVAIYMGLQWTSAARVIVFVYTAPIFVALGGLFLLPDQRLRPLQWVGMAIALAGVAVGVAGEAGGARQTFVGDALALLGGVAWAATTLLIKASALRTAPPAKVFLYQFGVSAPVLIAGSFFLGEVFPERLQAVTLLSFVYQTLWIACVTYLIWFVLIARYNVGELSAFTFLTPIVGVGAGYLVLGEPLSNPFMGGAALVVAGICIVNFPARSRS